MTVSEQHEDYSGPETDWWYDNPNTVIHELEWILEASALLLPRDDDHGNVAGDTNSTGWDGKPIDYVQGYGIVDAKRAVGIALTLERLRESYPLEKITVRDAISAYDRHCVESTTTIPAMKSMASWSGEYSRYNDQAGNPLSLVNQTKFVIVPSGANSAFVSLSYTPVDLTEFKVADLAFTVDYNNDGTEDYQSSLSPSSTGVDTAQLDVTDGGLWTFDIVGMGGKLQRPLQDVNYIELRIEYDIKVTFNFEGNGSENYTAGNAYYAPAFPQPEDGDLTGVYELEIGQYDLRDLTLEEVPPAPPKPKKEFPYGILAAIIALGLLLLIYLFWRKQGKKKSEE
jgi:hypothetical protein